MCRGKSSITRKVINNVRWGIDKKKFIGTMK